MTPRPLILLLLAALSYAALVPQTAAVVVTTAGTAVQLYTGATPKQCVGVVIQAQPGNGGFIYTGGSGVTSSNGIRLSAGDTISWIAAGNAASYNLGSFWINSSVNSEGVTYTCNQ